MEHQSSCNVIAAEGKPHFLLSGPKYDAWLPLDDVDMKSWPITIHDVNLCTHLAICSKVNLPFTVLIHNRD